MEHLAQRRFGGIVEPTGGDGVVNQRAHMGLCQAKALHEQGIFVDERVVEHLGVVGVDGHQHASRNKLADWVLADVTIHCRAEV